jgi:hypothetical protein
VIQLFRKPQAGGASNLVELADVDLAGVTDGDHFEWQGGKLVPTPPPGGVLIDYSENATGVVTGPVSNAAAGQFANGGAVAVPLTDIIVPPDERDVWLDAFGVGQQTVAGTGLAILEVWETTGAPAYFARTNGLWLPNNVAADARRNFDLRFKPMNLGPVAAQRTFQLRINIFTNVANAAWQLLNVNAAGFKSYLRAYAL